MLAADLIARTDALPHRDRTRTIIASARSLSVDDADTLAAELASGDRYARELGLLVARHASRFTAVLTVATADVDADLRAVAAFALPSFPEFDVATALTLHAEASAIERDALLRGVLRAGRAGLADSLIGVELAAHRLAAAARLLAAASPAVVERRIDELAPSLATAVRLAARHPQVFLAHAARELEALPPTARTTWWARRADALYATLSASTAEEVFTLAERRPPASGWQRAHARLLGALVRLDADRVVALVSANGAVNAATVLRRRALRILVESGSKPVLELASTLIIANHSDYVRLVLSASPPARRELIGRVAERTGVVSFGTLPLDRATPDELRFSRAREEVVRYEADGVAPWEPMARLPIAEGEPRFREMLQSSRASDRAVAYRSLIELVGYSRDPARLADLLASFTRLPNEQEPVRAAAVKAVCELPLRMFTPVVLPALRGLVADAYRAPDTSAAVTGLLRNLAVRLLRPPALDEFNAFAIRMLVDAPGPFQLPRLDELSPSTAAALVGAALPVIDEHRAIGRFDVLLNLTRALGRRAYDNGELATRLALVAQWRDQWIAREAIRLWLADPASRAERVRALVVLDPSCLAVPEVEQAVASVATDLLTARVLAGKVAGRFLEQDQVWLPPARWSSRWSGQQRRQAAERLAAVSARVTQEVWLQVRAVALAGAVPGFGRDILLAAAVRIEKPIAEQALAGLGRAGADDRVDAALIPALGNDRARVAGPASVRRSAALRRNELEAFIGAALRSGPKLSSRKLLLFSIGRADVADPWAIIGDILGETPGPDLQVAAISVALRRFSDPAARQLMHRFLRHSTRIATLLHRIDVTRVGPLERAEFADLVGRLADSDDRAVRSGAVWVAVHWVAFSASLRAVLWALAVDLDRPTTMIAESAAIRAMLDDGNPEGLEDAVRTLIDLASAESVDEPRARRRIEVLTAELARYAPPALDAAATAELTATTTALAAVDVLGIDAARLALRLVAEDATAVPLLATALADRPAVAGLVVELAWNSAADADRLRSRLLDAVPALAQGGEAEQVVAVAVLGRLRMSGPLVDPWLGILRTLRRSPHLEARERALRVGD